MFFIQLWRLARAAYSLSEEKSDQEEKKAFVFEGLTFAEKAYASDAASAASNLWMAIMNRYSTIFIELKYLLAETLTTFGYAAPWATTAI